MNLIDLRQVVTQVLGFLLMLAILRKFAWGPVLAMLEARRQKIADEFKDAERRKAEADEAKARYEQELRGMEAKARARMQEAIGEGQKVAAEIRSQAQADAQTRIQNANDDIMREREKAKEKLKDEVVSLSIRTAEKIINQKLDDATHRQLAGKFVDEVSALK
jgi:F-type H+-transporting ATPase subunit b